MKAVILAPYSNEWPVQFRQICRELQLVFSPDQVSVEHIGSTAVPGLVAKPVIDVLLGAPTLDAIEAKIEAMSDYGYGYVPKYEVELPDRRYFVRPESDGPRVHVHGVVQGARLWSEHLRFREWLRTDAALHAQYQALKLQLAATFAHDKSAYTAAKEPFIRAVLQR
jgi:GrpB-like predicted nucleotidyltransferase (UPF0157 family)